MVKRRKRPGEARSAQITATPSRTVELRGDALACAVAFGGGDAQKGAQFILDIFGATWWAVTRADDDEPTPKTDGPTDDEICDEGCTLHLGYDETFAW